MTGDPLSVLAYLPPGWKSVPLAQVASVNARIGWKGLTASEYVDDGYVLLAAPNLDSQNIDYEHVNYISEARYEESQEIALKVGDVLLVKDGSIGIVNVVRELPQPTTVNGSIAVVRPVGIASEFLALWLESTPMQENMRRMKDGMGVPHLFQRDIRKFKTPLPPVNVQGRISALLREELARVDMLVAKKQRLISLLEEESQAQISLAVTKGIDQGGKTVNSGVPWLGDVPVEWPIARMGLFARVQNGSTPSRANLDYWTGGTVPWLASSSLNEGIIMTETERISLEAMRDAGLELFQPGTVLVGLVGQGRTRGMPAVLGLSATISQNLAAIVPGKRLTGKYLYYYLKHAYLPLREHARGANQPALDCGVVSDFLMPLPPVAEQVRITKYLEAKLEGVGSLTSKLLKSIALIQERRQAVITSGVTGQLDCFVGHPMEVAPS